MLQSGMTAQTLLGESTGEAAPADCNDPERQRRSRALRPGGASAPGDTVAGGGSPSRFSARAIAPEAESDGTSLPFG